MDNKDTTIPETPEAAVLPGSKASPINSFKRPAFSMGKGVERTLNSITPGSIDPELESSRLMLGIVDKVRPVETASPVWEATISSQGPIKENTAVNEPSSARVHHQTKVPKETKGKSIPTGSTTTESVNEFPYNLRIVLSSEGSEILESLCLRIRSEIRQKKRRKQLVGLQTVAQHLFNQLISDEKFRNLIHVGMVESISVNKNESDSK